MQERERERERDVTRSDGDAAVSRRLQRTPIMSAAPAAAQQWGLQSQSDQPRLCPRGCSSPLSTLHLQPYLTRPFPFIQTTGCSVSIFRSQTGYQQIGLVLYYIAQTHHVDKNGYKVQCSTRLEENFQTVLNILLFLSFLC